MNPYNQHPGGYPGYNRPTLGPQGHQEQPPPQAYPPPMNSQGPPPQYQMFGHPQQMPYHPGMRPTQNPHFPPNNNVGHPPMSLPHPNHQQPPPLSHQSQPLPAQLQQSSSNTHAHKPSPAELLNTTASSKNSNNTDEKLNHLDGGTIIPSRDFAFGLDLNHEYENKAETKLIATFARDFTVGVSRLVAANQHFIAYTVKSKVAWYLFSDHNIVHISFKNEL